MHTRRLDFPETAMLLELDQARCAYASEVCAAAAIDDPRLWQALVEVPREASLGPAPWTLSCLPLLGGISSDPSPRRVWHNLAVMLPSGRWQTAPALGVMLLERLALQRGERVVAVGHDVAYPAALADWLVGGAHCVELSADAVPPTVPVAQGEAPLDALLLLAGCSHAPWPWLNRLRPGGRAVFALLGMEGTALYWLVQRPHAGERWAATPLGLAACDPWVEHWDPCEAAVADALSHRLLEAKSLLSTAGDGEDMVLVDDHGCFSLRA